METDQRLCSVDAPQPASLIHSVTLSSMAGTHVFSKDLSEPIDGRALSNAMIRRLAELLDVPPICITLSWKVVTANAADGHVRRTALVTYVVHNKDWTKDVDDGNFYECFICNEPCEDADEPLAKKTREENCVECNPCSSCTICSVFTRAGSR